MTTKQNANTDDYKDDNEILEDVLQAEDDFYEAVEDACNDNTRLVVAKGPPGTGKTFGVDAKCKKANIKSIDLLASDYEQEKNSTTDKLEWVQTRQEVVDGAVKRGSTYAKWALGVDLWGCKDNGVINIDDNDAVLKDVEFIGLLMQLTEQVADPEISYPNVKAVNEMRPYGVLPKFKSKAKVIITTNIPMLELYTKQQQMIDATKDSKQPYLGKDFITRWGALFSRGRYVDLQMDSPRSARVFCEHKVKETGMLVKSSYLESRFGRCLTKSEQTDAMAFLRKFQQHLKIPLDLRTYNKVAEKMITRGDRWERSAKVELLNRGDY